MKKSILAITMAALMLLSFGNMLNVQGQPVPKKDTVNIDSEAKPTNYYAVEDEASGSSTTTILIIVGAVVVVGAAGFFLLKKKK